MRIALLCLSVFVSSVLFADFKENLSQFKIANGLEVFVKENHSVPLAKIQITFRAGSIVETKELNGLCHLYEHMLFKGNAKYKDQTAFKAALRNLGVGDWNGATSTEYVTYYFTVPSDKLAEGIEFWSHVMKTPTLSEDELAKERPVVHNEISGDQSEPSYKLNTNVWNNLFPDYPWKKDVGGADLNIIDTATVEKLRWIKDHYYVPNNAVLLIGGDVDAKEVKKLIEKFFGDWKPSGGIPDTLYDSDLKNNIYIATNNFPTKGVIDVRFYFRGPNTGQDPEATYGADIWGQVLGNPEGKFKVEVSKAVSELFGGSRNIGAGYYTQKAGGESYFSFKIKVGEKNPIEAIKKLRSVLEKEIGKMFKETYFSKEDIAKAQKQISNEMILRSETIDGFIENISFWWASTSADYFLNYPERIQKVDSKEINQFLSKYINKKPYLMSIWVNEEDDKKFKLSEKINALNVKKKTDKKGKAL